ncbi:hypothetical protein ACH5RR_035411 [Cinchona calisaya]|uniref:U5 small nuclear ribonucleoprotein TSSC4 n=1 Tax=Cinchona calisaya TaxID=153742 RepID=A0ABD2Y3G0_9GENT
MEDYIFQGRAKTVFGSLSSPPPSPLNISHPLPLWYPSNFDKRGRSSSSSNQTMSSPHQHNKLEYPTSTRSYYGDHPPYWDVHSMIGLDSTLDHEDEEDDFDRMAQGIETRMLPNSFHDHIPEYYYYLSTQIGSQEEKHNASKYYYVVDDSDGDDFDSMSPLCKTKQKNASTKNLQPSFDDCRVDFQGSSNPPKQPRLKSILKKKQDAAVKHGKHVTFDLSFKDDFQSPPAKNYGQDADTTQNRKQALFQASEDEHPPEVPDYLLNPSKYTHYSLNSCSELDQVSNTQACTLYLQQAKKLKLDHSTKEASNINSREKSNVLYQL